MTEIKNKDVYSNEDHRNLFFLLKLNFNFARTKPLRRVYKRGSYATNIDFWNANPEQQLSKMQWKPIWKRKYHRNSKAMHTD
jgi:hypothetical protein